MRLAVAELADQLDISSRDVIDAAHDAGVDFFEVDGYDVAYEDFDRPTPLFSSRGYNEANDFIICLDDVEIVLDGTIAERFVVLTGAEL